MVGPCVLDQTEGYFIESFYQHVFETATVLNLKFLQDNHSRSVRSELCAMLYHLQYPQGRLVCVTNGFELDVSVDISCSSPNIGKWIGLELTSEKKRQLWIPPGFAKGFVMTSDSAEFLYKTTDYWFPEYECSLLCNDLKVGIEWPFDGASKLAAKDSDAEILRETEVFSWYE